MRTIPFMVSIDTEEDQWGDAGAPTTHNLRALPDIQAFFEARGMRCTYFTAWTAANDDFAAEYLRELHRADTAEFAAHLHPWNTPPASDRVTGPRAQMLCNLDDQANLDKLQRLTAVLTELRGSSPVSFRSGRWGLGPATVRALIACGYTVDSSVMPRMSWATDAAEGPNYVHAPTRPYGLSDHDILAPMSNAPLVEVPVTVGFSRRGHRTWDLAQRLTHREALGRSVGASVLHRLRLLRKVQLSPETNTAEEMAAMAVRWVQDGATHLQMYWHSQSLTPGLTPFVRTDRDRERFLAAVDFVLEALQRVCNLEFVTVGEFGQRWKALNR